MSTGNSLSCTKCFITVSCFKLQWTNTVSLGPVFRRSMWRRWQSKWFTSAPQYIFLIKAEFFFFFFRVQKRLLHCQTASCIRRKLSRSLKCSTNASRIFVKNWFEDFLEKTLLQLLISSTWRAGFLDPRGEDGCCAPSHSFQAAEAMYRQQCYKVMDTETTSLDCRLSKFAFKHV